MKNIEHIRLGELPDDLAAIARAAGRNPDDFVYMTNGYDAWAIFEQPEAPTYEALQAMPLAMDDESVSFLDFWWDIRENWQWVCDANNGVEGFRRLFSP